MSYYTSANKTEVEAYNAYVSGQIGLSSPYGWADLRKHPTRDEWAILKHEIHTSDTLQEVSELPEDWQNEVEP